MHAGSSPALGTRTEYKKPRLGGAFYILFWCLYFTKSEPIFKTNRINKEERTKCVLSIACRPDGTLSTARACGNSEHSLRKQSLVVTLAIRPRHSRLAPLGEPTDKTIPFQFFVRLLPKSYRFCIPCGSFVSLCSQNSSQGLAKLQVFASHPSTEKERKVRKWFWSGGFAASVIKESFLKRS